MARIPSNPLRQAKLAMELHADSATPLEEAAAKRGLTIREANRLQKTLRGNAYRAFSASDLVVAVSAFAAAKPGRSMTALQAGANDGKSEDPIHALVHRYFSKVVLIEPQPQLIPALARSYEGFAGEAIIENVAVGPGGELTMYFPTPEIDAVYQQKRKFSASRLGSFDRAHVADRLVAATGIPAEEVDRVIQKAVVPCVTLEALAEKHLPEGVDLLQIDCEGYDWMVLKTIGRIRPAIINFEYDKLPDDHWKEWKAWAAENGYAFIRGLRDALAVRGAVF